MMTSVPTGFAVTRPGRFMPTGRPLFWAVMVPVCGATGLLYAMLFDPREIWQPVVYAALIGSLTLAFERGIILRAVHDRIKRAPTLVYIVLAELTYVALTVAGNGVAGVLLWSAGLTRGPLADAAVPTLRVLPSRSAARLCGCSWSGSATSSAPTPSSAC